LNDRERYAARARAAKVRLLVLVSEYFLGIFRCHAGYVFHG